MSRRVLALGLVAGVVATSAAAARPGGRSTPKNDPISHRDHFHIEANPRDAAAPPTS